MQIMQCDHYVVLNNLYCSEHCRAATHVLNIDDRVIIPLCQECVDDLHEELTKHVSAERKEGSAE